MTAGDDFDARALDRLRRIGGTDLVGRIIHLFLETLETRLAEGHAAAGRGDRAGVQQALHALVSSAGNVGARQLMHLSQVGQREAADADPPALQELMRRVEDAARRLRPWLDAQRKG